MRATKSFFSFLVITLCLGFNSFSQILDPAKWSYNVKKLSDKEVELQFTVKLDAGWHVYSQNTDPNGPLPIVFHFTNAKDYKRVGGVKEPNPTKVYDEMFKANVLYFSNTVVFRQKIEVQSENDFTVKGSLEYQLCNDGSCIPPDDVPFSFNVKGVKGAVPVVDTAMAAGEQKDTAIAIIGNKDSNSQVAKVEATQNGEVTKADDKKEGSLWKVFFVAFGLGLLALITPCVFPMIPMTISFFMKGGGNRKKGIQQALVFGSSIILIFSVLGLLLTVIFGKDAMYIISTHWAPNLFFFAVFIFFALSFFGLFEITMPSSLVNKSDEKADKGGFFAPFFIALTTVLVSFSCTGPILGTALIELTSDGASRLVPFISMVGFAIGFALPFTLLAMFPSLLSKMKSGGWLNTVKIVFGFIEIALALKFLSMADLSANWGILSRETYLCIWIIVFAFLGFYLLGKLRFKGDAPIGEISVGRLFLSIVTLSFVVYMIPGLWGAPLKAISGYIPPPTTQDFDMIRISYENSPRGQGMTSAHHGNNSGGDNDMLPADRKYAKDLHLPTGFEGFYDLEEAKAYAKKVNKPIFIDFTGKTCANCRQMENSVWIDPKVKQLLNDEFVMVALYADVNFIDLPEKEWVTTKEGKVIKTLGKKNLNYQITTFNMNAQPYYVLMDFNEKVLTKENKVFDRNVDNFVKFLNEGMDSFKKLHKK